MALPIHTRFQCNREVNGEDDRPNDNGVITCFYCTLLMLQLLVGVTETILVDESSRQNDHTYIRVYRSTVLLPRSVTGWCHGVTLKPSSTSAFDVRPEWPVGCSLAVSVQTRSDPKNSNGGPCSTCPVFLWKYSVMEQTPPHLVDCSTLHSRKSTSPAAESIGWI